jgi:hypothetical protein
MFIEVCAKLNIPYISPILLTRDNAWFSGMFDSDGTIAASFSPVYPRVFISVSSKHEMDISHFLIFGGNTYFDKQGSGTNKWTISGQQDILNMLKYFEDHGSKTHKLARLLLVMELYELGRLKGKQSIKHFELSPYYNSWKVLRAKWKIWSFM